MATQQDTRLNGTEPDSGINNVDDTQGAAVTDQYSGLDAIAPVEVTPEVTPEGSPETGESPATDEALTQRDQELSRREQEQNQRERDTADREQDAHVQQSVVGYYEQQAQTNTQSFESDREHPLYPEPAKYYGQKVAVQEAKLANSQYVAKILAEKLVSLETGISRDLLQGVWDEKSMRDLATQHKRMGGPERQELESLQKKFNVLEDQVRKGTVSAQSFNQAGGSGAGSGGDAEINRRYARGEIGFTPAVREARQRLFGS